MTKRQKLAAIDASLRSWCDREENGYRSLSHPGCALCRMVGVYYSDLSNHAKCEACPVSSMSDDEYPCEEWAWDYEVNRLDDGASDAGPAIIALCLLRAMVESGDA